mmetsp:Transcript_12721/g.33633  ORF Transcript_12721/g.33633 Transcript_12721/m.33633 type:complete len:251 (+) Transcript_12721:1399-2151(+)
MDGNPFYFNPVRKHRDHQAYVGAARRRARGLRQRWRPPGGIHRPLNLHGDPPADPLKRRGSSHGPVVHGQLRRERDRRARGRRVRGHGQRGDECPQHRLRRRDERRELRVRLLPRRRRRSERDSGEYDSVTGGRYECLRAELALRLAHHVDDGPRRAQVHGARDREWLRLRQDLRGCHSADGLFAHGAGGGAEAALRGDGLDAAPEARLRGPRLRDVRVGRPRQHGREERRDARFERRLRPQVQVPFEFE